MLTGIHFIPAMIGLFGVSEVLRGMWKLDRSAEDLVSATDIPESNHSFLAMIGYTLSRLVKRPIAALRSCSLGTLIGMVPGAGADIAAWISYSISKKMSPTPEEYGKGSIDSIADASSANNSSLAGAWIPALVLGIPGDSVTAILIGVLMMKNITPGPEIFLDPKQTTLVYSIYLSFIVANLLLIPLGYLGIRASRWILRVPRRILLPVILLFCIVGSYSISGSQFDVLLMLAFGLLGFLLEHYRFPLGPVVLGILLGAELEKSFVQNLTKDPSLLEFFSRPVAATLGAVCLLLWLYPLIRMIWRYAHRTSDQAHL
ncbi:MAG TPA: tripartite tricarboxylate transporter permease, partial [Planctomycetaceae bacterium]|nr:tripartite tricarboxylate transporter permease [Planctomycetaceae bacterium]